MSSYYFYNVNELNNNNNDMNYIQETFVLYSKSEYLAMEIFHI